MVAASERARGEASEREAATPPPTACRRPPLHSPRLLADCIAARPPRGRPDRRRTASGTAASEAALGTGWRGRKPPPPAAPPPPLLPPSPPPPLRLAIARLSAAVLLLRHHSLALRAPRLLHSVSPLRAPPPPSQPCLAALLLSAALPSSVASPRPLLLACCRLASSLRSPLICASLPISLASPGCLLRSPSKKERESER